MAVVTSKLDRRAVLAGAAGTLVLGAAGGARAAPRTQTAAPTVESLLLTYEPITQVRARKVNFYRSATGGVAGRQGDFYWGELSQTEVRGLLSNYSQWVTAYRFSASGEGKAPLVSGKLDKGTYRIVIDFLRYMTQSVVDENNTVIGRCVVGVGLRTVADINNFTANGEASLVALAAKAQANQADGKLRFDSIGIATDDVSALMPTSASLDESGIVDAAAATAAIKGLMKDERTLLVPHVIAVQYDKASTEPVRTKLMNLVLTG